MRFAVSPAALFARCSSASSRDSSPSSRATSAASSAPVPRRRPSSSATRASGPRCPRRQGPRGDLRRRPGGTGAAAIEVAARNLHGIDEWRRRFDAGARALPARARRCSARNTPRRSRNDIAAHYDLGNDLFGLMLDDTIVCSSAIFERRDMTLKEASRAKLDRICDKLDLQPSDHVLKIGTGWGGFALHAAADPRLPRHDHDPVARAARPGAGARPRGRAEEGPRDDPAGRTTRTDRGLRQARLDRDDRGRRLEGFRDVLRGAARNCCAPTA